MQVPASFQPRPALPQPSWQLGGHVPSPPSFLPPQGLQHKAWQLSMLPVLSALTKCFIPAAARAPGAVTQQRHPHRGRPHKNTHREQGTSWEREGVGHVQVWGLWVPSQPRRAQDTSPQSHFLCTPRVCPYCLLGLRTDPEVTSPAHCAMFLRLHQGGTRGICRDAPGHGDGERGVLRLWLLFSSLQKDFKSYSFFLHGFTCLPLEEGMPRDLGRSSALQELNPHACSAWAITQRLLHIPGQVPSPLPPPPNGKNAPPEALAAGAGPCPCQPRGRGSATLTPCPRPPAAPSRLALGSCSNSGFLPRAGRHELDELRL